MLYKVTFVEHGKKRIQYANISDDMSENAIIDWYGLNESDISFYEIEKIPSNIDVWGDISMDIV